MSIFVAANNCLCELYVIHVAVFHCSEYQGTSKELLAFVGKIGPKIGIRHLAKFLIKGMP